MTLFKHRIFIIYSFQSAINLDNVNIHRLQNGKHPARANEVNNIMVNLLDSNTSAHLEKNAYNSLCIRFYKNTVSDEVICPLQTLQYVLNDCSLYILAA